MTLTEHHIPTEPGVRIAVHEAPCRPSDTDAPATPTRTLLLLHGFPQTHRCWVPALPALTRHFRCLLVDLRGYGASSMPPEDAAHEVYSKRAMARDLVAVLDHFDLLRATVVGHDRGARVAYRFALDHPDRVEALTVLDVVPTLDFWNAWTADLAMAAYHWTFLAQKAPLPETLISQAPQTYLEHILGSWTGTKDLSPFPADSLAAYRAQMADTARVSAMCADYRAGWHVDRVIDAEDAAAGRQIAAPTLFLWGEHGFPARTGDPLGAWRGWAPNVTGHALASGHFAPEEATEAVTTALINTYAAS